jgi:hypothetical protein
MTSREQTASYLCNIERIKAHQFDVWRRHEHGAATSDLAEEYGKTTRSIQYWIRRVNDAIETERRGRPKWGHTVASGSKCRHVDDPTPQSRKPRSKFPSAERLMETKKRPR